MADEYWAGCNYYANQGNVHEEPIGTATSMHECGDCERIEHCLVKQTKPIFELNRQELDNRWNEMMRREREAKIGSDIH